MPSRLAAKPPPLAVVVYMDKMPQTKADADEFLSSIKWDEGMRLFSELKKLAKQGRPAIFEVIEGRYPKAYMMICAELDNRSLAFHSLCKALVEAWSDNELSLNGSITGTGGSFNLTLVKK